MSVTAVIKDPDRLTMTITAEYDVPAERAWQLWDDPRQLERWWGPPTFPATVVEHHFTPGGTVTYFMTGPQGEQYHGWWRILQVEPPRLLVFEDGFADANGQPDAGMPTTVTRVSFRDRDPGGVVMTVQSTFPSVEAMEQLVAMGMEEGFAAALSQIDAVIEEG